MNFEYDGRSRSCPTGRSCLTGRACPPRGRRPAVRHGYADRGAPDYGSRLRSLAKCSATMDIRWAW